MTAKIVVVGSFNVDLTSYMERIPVPGETVMGDRFVTGPGGKGSNQAVAAARLGADVTFIGRIGQDVFASIALTIWQNENINLDYLVQDPDHATGVAPIFVENSGENSIVVVLGANLTLTTADLDAAAERIAQADVLVTQLEIKDEIAAHALKLARDHGVTTILNPAPARPLPPAMLTLADYLTPNETELATLAGRAVTDDVIEMARALLTSDQQTVITTLGSVGARYVQAGKTALVPTYPVDVVDTTGAGDAFNGGLAVALAEGKSLDEALAFANATAALCVTKPGTAPSMPDRRTVDELLQTQ
ncbi:MAG: ribokinase [Chloroflexi bacterium]|nr:ribokinase [Chloroflexota bacterium]